MPRTILAATALIAIFALVACSPGASARPSSAASQAASPSAAASAASPAASASPDSSPSAAGSASAACAPSTDDATVDATIADFAFDPEPLQAKVGGTVGWTNEDAAPHTATLDEGDCGTGSLAQGATGALTFGAAGTYAYHCEIHPNMKGTVEVTE